jgi:hypothetical protein
MDLTGFDFSQPARVLWFTHVSRDGQISAGESRPFLEVTDALRFIMEKLDGVHHATASITLDNGSLTLTEVMLLYSRLGRDQRYPDFIESVVDQRDNATLPDQGHPIRQSLR